MRRHERTPLKTVCNYQPKVNKVEDPWVDRPNYPWGDLFGVAGSTADPRR